MLRKAISIFDLKISAQRFVGGELSSHLLRIPVLDICDTFIIYLKQFYDEHMFIYML